MNETGSVKQHVLTWTWIWRSYFWNTENRMDYTHTQRTHRDRCTPWTGWFATLSIWPRRCKLHWVSYILEPRRLRHFSFFFFFLNKSSLHINTRVSGVQSEHQQLDATALQQAKKRTFKNWGRRINGRLWNGRKEVRKKRKSDQKSEGTISLWDELWEHGLDVATEDSSIHISSSVSCDASTVINWCL